MKIDIERQRRASYLLPDPGGEVVRGLLDEIERLRRFEDACTRLGLGPRQTMDDLMSRLGPEYQTARSPQTDGHVGTKPEEL